MFRLHYKLSPFSASLMLSDLIVLSVQQYEALWQQYKDKHRYFRYDNLDR